jgi:hypothetical protein
MLPGHHEAMYTICATLFAPTPQRQVPVGDSPRAAAARLQGLCAACHKAMPGYLSDDPQSQQCSWRGPAGALECS